MPVRGLKIIVVEASTARLHAALSIAAASAATGAATRVHLHGDAARLLAPPVVAGEDARHAAAGLPTLGQMMEQALALDVEITACQSGLTTIGISAGALDGRIRVSGLVAVIASTKAERLIIV